MRLYLLVSTITERTIDGGGPTGDSTWILFRNSERTRRNMPSLAGDGGVPEYGRLARRTWPTDWSPH